MVHSFKSSVLLPSSHCTSGQGGLLSTLGITCLTALSEAAGNLVDDLHNGLSFRTCSIDSAKDSTRGHVSTALALLGVSHNIDIRLFILLPLQNSHFICRSYVYPVPSVTSTLIQQVISSVPYHAVNHTPIYPIMLRKEMCQSRRCGLGIVAE